MKNASLSPFVLSPSSFLRAGLSKDERPIRVSALLLTFSLAVPNPALAMRAQGADGASRAGLEEALREPHVIARSPAGATKQSLLATGLEEPGEAQRFSSTGLLWPDVWLRMTAGF